MDTRKTSATLQMVLAAMMVALVMVSNYISIPTAFSRLHVANAVCVLAGFLFGGVRGGIIAGLGSALFDLTFPAYAAESWITFLTKGTMALVSGLVLHKSKKITKPVLRLGLAALAGVVCYIFLYLTKSYLQLRFVSQVPVDTIPVALSGKLVSSAINGLFAVIVAPLLYLALVPALKGAGLYKLFPGQEENNIKS